MVITPRQHGLLDRKTESCVQRNLRLLCNEEFNTPECYKVNEIGDSWNVSFSGPDATFRGFLWSLLVQDMYSKFFSEYKIRIGIHYGAIDTFQFHEYVDFSDIKSLFHAADLESRADIGGINMSGAFTHKMLLDMTQSKWRANFNQVDEIRDRILDRLSKLDTDIFSPIKSDTKAILGFIQIDPRVKAEFFDFIAIYIDRYSRRFPSLTFISTQDSGTVWNFINDTNNKEHGVHDVLNLVRLILKTIPEKMFRVSYHMDNYYFINDSEMLSSKRYLSHAQNIAYRVLHRNEWGSIGCLVNYTHSNKFKRVKLVSVLKGLSYDEIYVAKLSNNLTSRHRHSTGAVDLPAI